MTNSSSHEDGGVSEQELAYYRERSGGVGAVITASSHVTLEGIAFINEIGVDDDSLIPSLKILSGTIQAQGAKAILQITYLIQQFFSAYSNLRTDQWGGTLEKRMAFPLAVIKSVKEIVAKHAKVPFIVGYRLSPEERESSGITMDDTLQLVDVLAEQKLDYIHISVRGFWDGSIRDETDTNSRVLLIQGRVGNRVPVIGVGGLSSPEDVIKALETGVPLLALAHAIIMEPKWVEKVRDDRENEIRTTLPKTAQKDLVIPDALWNMLINVPGWFPVV